MPGNTPWLACTRQELMRKMEPLQVVQDGCHQYVLLVVMPNANPKSLRQVHRSQGMMPGIDG